MQIDYLNALLFDRHFPRRIRRHDRVVIELTYLRRSIINRRSYDVDFFYSRFLALRNESLHSGLESVKSLFIEWFINPAINTVTGENNLGFYLSQYTLKSLE